MARSTLYSLLLVILVAIQLTLVAGVSVGARVGSARLQDGVYAVSRPQEQLITGEGSSPRSPAFLLPPTGQPGQQEFAVTRNADGTVNIKNIKSGLYLSGQAQANSPVTFEEQPTTWHLIQGSEESSYVIAYPGDPVDGQTLVVDSSLLRIFPPRLAIRPLYSEQAQQFRFELHQ